MENGLFDDWVQSLKEAKEISKGEVKAARRFEISSPDARSIRESGGLSQADFARLMRSQRQDPAKLGAAPTPTDGAGGGFAHNCWNRPRGCA